MVDYDDATSTPGIFVPTDATFNPYYTVLCNLDGLTSKIFLVNDTTAGIQTLMQPEMQYTITGGVANNCTLFGLQSTFPGFS